MAFPHPTGLEPSEVAFLCEMEQVTVVPRQRLERLDLLGGPTSPLIPPQRTNLPLWLAILLKQQRRANIIPPPWLRPDSLDEILELETRRFKQTFSPAPPLPSETRNIDGGGKSFITASPFVDSVTANVAPNALPYHWLEVSEILLESASDDMTDPDTIRRLLRDIREVRLAKMRSGVDALSGEGDGVRLDGVGAMEVAESRNFILGVIDGLRRIGASKEQARREREEEERENGRYEDRDDDDEDQDMT